MRYHAAYDWLVSYEVIFAGHALYLAILVVILKGLSQPIEQIKGAMMVYNATQVIISILTAAGLSSCVLNGLFNLNGKHTARIEFWIFVHYLTKYLDMFDSFFMAIRKKGDQLSFLHLYHHTTIGVIWGVLLHNNVANGTAFFGAWINSVVHALMYFHYLWTSFGLHNPLKQYLTMVQMFQFCLCIIHAVLVVLYDKTISLDWALLQVGYHMTLLYLFANFFRSMKTARKPKAE